MEDLIREMPELISLICKHLNTVSAICFCDTTKALHVNKVKILSKCHDIRRYIPRCSRRSRAFWIEVKMGLDPNIDNLSFKDSTTSLRIDLIYSIIYTRSSCNDFLKLMHKCRKNNIEYSQSDMAIEMMKISSVNPSYVHKYSTFDIEKAICHCILSGNPIMVSKLMIFSMKHSIHIDWLSIRDKYAILKDDIDQGITFPEYKCIYPCRFEDALKILYDLTDRYK